MSAVRIFESILLAVLALLVVANAVKLARGCWRHRPGEPFLNLALWSPWRRLLFRWGLVASGAMGAIVWLWLAYTIHQDQRPLLESGLPAPQFIENLITAAFGTWCWLTALQSVAAWRTARIVNRVSPVADYAAFSLLGTSLLLWVIGLRG
jgi:hypothetical protein